MLIPKHSHKIFKRTGDKTTLESKKFYGWLGSGIFDENGNEIFEGDIVKTPRTTAAVTFENGAFYVEGDRLSNDFALEVIGHIAEEP